MSAVAAARVGDEIAHGFGVAAMIGGAILGAVVGAAIVAAAAVTAPLAIAVIVGGSIAVGALSMKQLVKGISTVFKLPEPTTGTVKKGSENVFINGRPAVRAGLDLTTPCSGNPLNHFPSSSDVVVADGSSTVIVNGYPVARLKDKIACGAHIKQRQRERVRRRRDRSHGRCVRSRRLDGNRLRIAGGRGVDRRGRPGRGCGNRRVCALRRRHGGHGCRAGRARSYRGSTRPRLSRSATGRRRARPAVRGTPNGAGQASPPATSIT